MLLFLSEFLGCFVDSVVKVNVDSGKNVVTPHSAVFGARVLLIEYKWETSRGIPGAFRCSCDLIKQNYNKFVATYMVTH